MVFGFAMIVFIFSGAVLALMLQDVEVQKRTLRRYIRRLDKEGQLGKLIGWFGMKHAPFVRPAWFFKVPKPEERPDLYSYPELVEVIERIKRNWVIIGWISLVFIPSAVIVLIGILKAAPVAE
jgi:hypothetical protein